MERSTQQPRASTPTPEPLLRESPALIRELYKLYESRVANLAACTYAQILFEQPLPAVAALFSSMAHTEMRHHITMGALLRDLGVSHALRTTVRQDPYHLNEDADSHAPVVARRILKDRIRDEKNAAAHCLRLADSAATERVRRTLSALAHDQADHAAALGAMETRLARS